MVTTLPLYTSISTFCWDSTVCSALGSLVVAAVLLWSCSFIVVIIFIVVLLDSDSSLSWFLASSVQFSALCGHASPAHCTVRPPPQCAMLEHSPLLSSLHARGPRLSCGCRAAARRLQRGQAVRRARRSRRARATRTAPGCAPHAAPHGPCGLGARTARRAFQ